MRAPIVRPFAPLSIGLLAAAPGCKRSESPAAPAAPATVTRAELAEWIVAARYGSTFEAPAEPVFQNVPASHPRFRFIQKMAAEGITNGFAGDATRFGANEEATRFMLAAFLVRARYGATCEFPAQPAFEDVPATYGVFKEIQRAAADGLLPPCRPGAFCQEGFPTPEETKAAIALAFPPAPTARP